MTATMTPKSQHRMGVFRRDGNRCCMAGAGPCEGPLQAHHVVPVQRIKTVRSHWEMQERFGRYMPPDRAALVATPLDDLVADERNGVVVCEKHHLKPWLIPEPLRAKEFREEYGL